MGYQLNQREFETLQSTGRLTTGGPFLQKQVRKDLA